MLCFSAFDEPVALNAASDASKTILWTPLNPLCTATWNESSRFWSPPEPTISPPVLFLVKRTLVPELVFSTMTPPLNTSPRSVKGLPELISEKRPEPRSIIALIDSIDWLFDCTKISKVNVSPDEANNLFGLNDKSGVEPVPVPTTSSLEDLLTRPSVLSENVASALMPAYIV